MKPKLNHPWKARFKTRPHLITVRITRNEFNLLPVETRRRILAEQAEKLIK